MKPKWLDKGCRSNYLDFIVEYPLTVIQITRAMNNGWRYVGISHPA